VPPRASASPDQSLHPENLQQRRLESDRGCPEGEGEMNANQFFKSERKPVFHWFLLALLVFTIIDYLFVPR
jgi:hypothetical protein